MSYIKVDIEVDGPIQIIFKKFASRGKRISYLMATMLVMLVFIDLGKDSLAKGALAWKLLDSYQSEMFSFAHVPNQWELLEKPSTTDSIELSRSLGGDLHEILPFRAYTDTEFMAVMNRKPYRSVDNTSLGIVSLLSKNLQSDPHLENLENELFKKVAQQFIKSQDRDLKVNTRKIGGQSWAFASNTRTVKVQSSRTGEYVNQAGLVENSIYWTYIKGKLIIVLAVTFIPTKDEANQQVELFIESFRVSGQEVQTAT